MVVKKVLKYSQVEKENYSLFKMNIPIFSKDGQRACVYSGYYCGGLCGGGNAYYLRKEKSGWKIVYSHPTWIS